MSGPRVLFWVQHLLGIGHVRRAATVARALDDVGLDVVFASGGFPVPGLDLGGGRLAQLPPVRATDLYFKELVDEHDRPIDDAWRDNRRDALLALLAEVRPDAILTELFPFGRRQMRFELTPFLEAARAMTPRPVICASVRDILVAQSKPGRNEEMVERLETYYDHALVHGDPAFIALDRTFPHAATVAGKLHYTGYVVDARGTRRGAGHDGWDEVLVSAGGGAVGDKLLRTAMAARALTAYRDRTWRVLAGVNVADDALASLRAEAPDGVIVELSRGDFPDLLMNCAVSISQAGYNTTMEAIRAGCRIVTVPYAGGLETEQTLRAEALAEHGVLQVVPEADLSPETLAAAVDAARPAARFDLDTEGAATAARLLAQWIGSR
ncbi:MAG: glycosyltransferase [Alphaproteobacteria bacterium]